MELAILTVWILFAFYIYYITARPSKTFWITVKKRTLAEAIIAGSYNWAHPNINEDNFPEKVGRDYSIECIFFRYWKPKLSDFVIDDMKKYGFQPANIYEGLAVGEIKPNLQRRFPIVILRSVWCDTFGIYAVPVLCCNLFGRRLDLFSSSFVWSKRYRFLGVRITTDGSTGSPS